jgi:hypothetical protein
MRRSFPGGSVDPRGDGPATGRRGDLESGRRGGPEGVPIMDEVGTGAERPRGEAARRPGKGEAKREGAKPLGSGKRPGEKTVRRQFHLGERTAQRLGVHCSLVDRNESAIVEEILGSWLTRYGRGRELWASEDRGVQLAPDTQEDRQLGPAA